MLCAIRLASAQMRMDTWLSKDLPLMTVPISYLDVTSLGNWRHASKENLRTTRAFTKTDWLEYVHTQTRIHQCGICKRNRKITSMFHCQNCSRTVCGEHVFGCRCCDELLCSDCVHRCRSCWQTCGSC